VSRRAPAGHGARALVVAVVLATAAGSGGARAFAGPAGGGGAPRAGLQRAATGTWSGPFGTLTFRADGSASFAVRSCGFAPVRLGFVRPFTDCEPEEIDGHLRVDDGGYVLVEADGTETDYAAYLDGAGLHLGFGVVDRLDRDREGLVELAPGERLEVGRRSCTYRAPVLSEPVHTACAFVRSHGRTLLRFRKADPTDDTKTVVDALVYLPASRLLVSPELVERTFTTTSG